jgi:hypothetical protein
MQLVNARRQRPNGKSHVHSERAYREGSVHRPNLSISAFVSTARKLFGDNPGLSNFLFIQVRVHEDMG